MFIESGSGSPLDLQPFLGMKARPFHPTELGHMSVKDSMMAAVKGIFLIF
jgi:hypothetical protein